MPIYTGGQTFLDVTLRDKNASFCVAGVPFDIGATNRSAARFGPQAIRQASRMLVDGVHPGTWSEPTRAVSDIGNFQIALGDIRESLRLIEDQAAGIQHLVALGGERTITLPLLRAAARRHGAVGLIRFDAHVDTWPDNFGQRYGVTPALADDASSRTISTTADSRDCN